MPSRFRSILCALPLLLAASCGHDPVTGPIVALPRPLTVAEGRLVATDNRFALKLFRQVAAEGDPSENLFISPLSIAMALGMTLNGAAGTTYDSMRLALELGSLTPAEINQSYRSLIELLRGLDPGVDFTLANSIWYREEYTFEPAFLDTNRVYFDARIQGLDFAAPSAPGTIDAWVSEQTRGRIASIAPNPLPPDAIMFLINAVYFKGDWTERFERARTQDAPFRRRDGSTTTVRMMSHAGEVQVGLAREGSVQVLDLPYAGGAFSMTIAMPDDPAAIDSLVANLTLDQWGGWIGALDSAEILVSMPKFVLTSDLTLNGALSALGMGVAFSPQDADFSRMLGSRGPYITNVKHKTFVDVNEEGTEAAAVTSVGIGVTSAPQAIIVARPFVFVIRERFSGTILFIGKVVDPAAG
ncbi:MAG: serpin family protein [Gemmatimonadales bacterium]|nr:serpin family protein [Gemmatimonadales bacterium]